MEQTSAFKQAEGNLSMLKDRISKHQARLEDLVFRAQRIATAIKNGAKVTDAMFESDLQSFRREVRSFSNEISSLPAVIGSLERAATYDAAALNSAQALMRLCDQIAKALRSLHEHALIAHQHIREADYKVVAWYVVQELEQMAQKAQSLPATANKIIMKVGTPAEIP